MFKSISTLVALFAVATSAAVASTPLVVPVGIAVNGGNAEFKVAPSAILSVNLSVETESLEAGPYARYAQKFLGVRASLLSRSNSTIIGATVSKLDSETPAQAVEPTLESSVDMLPVNMTSPIVQSDEFAAAAAATEIFRLRRLRRDLISGDLGEGFFGGGLEAALRQIDRDEEQYTQLFMGRVTKTVKNYRFEVDPNSKDQRYVVCRFAADRGVLPAQDLSAEPVMLQITPSNEKLIEPLAEVKGDTRNFRVANNSRCELYVGTSLVGGGAIIPLFEFGYDLKYPVGK